jgi:hypothetical protein
MRASGTSPFRPTTRAATSRKPAGQRRALGALFLVLALALAGVAAAAADAARHEIRLVVIAVAAGALALWLATLALRALRTA